MYNDTMKVYYCTKCNWQIETKLTEAVPNQCGNCNKRGLSFIIGDEREIDAFFKENNERDNKSRNKSR